MNMLHKNAKIYNELNEEQECSETDSFTTDRYRQFFDYLPVNDKVPMLTIIYGSYLVVAEKAIFSSQDV